jgi:L-malate glycosyltransferase
VLAEAFAQVNTGGRDATLILNGDWPVHRFNVKRIGTAVRHLGKLDSLRRGALLVREAGLKGLTRKMFPKLPNGQSRLALAPRIEERPMPANFAGSARKTVLPVDLPREKVIDAFFEADLFVFASKVEYSPLVLFESAAAGTPFLTVPAGNADEIVRWTGGGWLCPADVDDHGYVKVSPAVLAREIEKGIRAPERLRMLGEAGRAAWRERFTWGKIAQLYECVLRGERVTSFMASATIKAAQGM